jgi:hypothetical protein
MPLLARISSWFTERPSTHPSIGTDSVPLDALRAAISPVRGDLLAHPIYRVVNSMPRLQRFMGYHVFAVWDFMCLAKRLQRDLTSLDTLWMPPSRPALARFINGVIFGEESDLDPDGHASSHFDLYLSAMEEVGAPTAPARRFISMLRDGADVQVALAAAGAPQAARAFVANTLRTVEQGTTVEVLSSFLFGREDLIPDMFSRILPQWAEVRQARRFAYYVERHIELDGDDHGPAGQRALAELAADDAAAWHAAGRAAQNAMIARIALWDGVHADLLDS